jgi:hypothetical protein
MTQMKRGAAYALAVVLRFGIYIGGVTGVVIIALLRNGRPRGGPWS